MRKGWVWLFSLLVLITTIIPGSVLAEESGGDSRLVTSRGLLTPSWSGTDTSCEEQTEGFENFFNPELDTPEENEFEPGTMLKVLSGLITGLVELAMETIFANSCGGFFDVISLFLFSLKPLNITNVQAFMAVFSVTQSLAKILLVVTIPVYAIKLMTGNTGRFPLNPAKFFIYLFIIFITIDIVPYLMQDILGLNNFIVHYITHVKFTVPGFSESVNVIQAVPAALALNLNHYLIGTEGEASAHALMMISTVFLIIIFALKDIMKIVLFWVMRAVNIVFVGALLPIIIILLLIDSTANIAKRMIAKLVGEIFSQSFLAVGILVAGLVIVNINSVDAELGGLHPLIVLLITYAMVKLVAKSIDYGESVLGNIGAVDGEKNEFKKMKNLGQKAVKALASKGEKSKSVPKAGDKVKLSNGMTGKFTKVNPNAGQIADRIKKQNGSKIANRGGSMNMGKPNVKRASLATGGKDTGSNLSGKYKLNKEGSKRMGVTSNENSNLTETKNNSSSNKNQKLLESPKIGTNSNGTSSKSTSRSTGGNGTINQKLLESPKIGTNSSGTSSKSASRSTGDKRTTSKSAGGPKTISSSSKSTAGTKSNKSQDSSEKPPAFSEAFERDFNAWKRHSFETDRMYKVRKNALHTLEQNPDFKNEINTWKSNWKKQGELSGWNKKNK